MTYPLARAQEFPASPYATLLDALPAGVITENLRRMCCPMPPAADVVVGEDTPPVVLLATMSVR